MFYEKGLKTYIIKNNKKKQNNFCSLKIELLKNIEFKIILHNKKD